MCGYSNQCRQAGGGYIVSDCAKLQWELTIARGVSDFDIEHRQFGNKYIVQYREFSIEVSCLIDLQRKIRYNKSEVITMEKNDDTQPSRQPYRQAAGRRRAEAARYPNGNGH